MKLHDECKTCLYLRERASEKGPVYTCLFNLFKNNIGQKCEHDEDCSEEDDKQ